jgi:ankyrin repeat protein
MQGDRISFLIACEEGHTEVVIVLLAAGANIEARDIVSPSRMKVSETH